MRYKNLTLFSLVVVLFHIYIRYFTEVLPLAVFVPFTMVAIGSSMVQTIYNLIYFVLDKISEEKNNLERVFFLLEFFAGVIMFMSFPILFNTLNPFEFYLFVSIGLYWVSWCFYLNFCWIIFSPMFKKGGRND